MADQQPDMEGEENQEEMQPSASQQRLEKFKLYVVKPEMIEPLWNSEDPCTFAQDLLLEHIDDLSAAHGTNYQEYDENEKRYEKNMELKLLADYLINCLVFCKESLKSSDDDTTAEILHVMWKTLDFLNYEDEIDQEDGAVHKRYRTLQDELTVLFQEKKIDRKGVSGLLEYMKCTLFAHLQLYLQCLRQKQSRRTKPIKIMASTPLAAPAGGLDEAKDLKSLDEEEGDMAGMIEGTINNDSVNDVAPEDAPKEEEQEEVVDPDDPLYGLEQRLKYSDLDEDTKNIIKQKLAEAKEKINEQLEQRQQNLDQKLAAGGKKK